MTSGAQSVLQNALRLSPDERAEVVEGLLQSLGAKPQACTDALWRAEAESRIDACDAGRLSADSAEAVLERIACR